MFVDIKHDASIIALGAGVIAALLQLLDWVLSDQQKTQVSDKLLNTWVWLEEQKPDVIIRSMLSLRVQKVLLGLYGALYAISIGAWFVRNASYEDLRDDPMFVAMMISIVAVIGGAGVVAFFLWHRRFMRQLSLPMSLGKQCWFFVPRLVFFSIGVIFWFACCGIAIRLTDTQGYRAFILVCIGLVLLLPIAAEGGMLWNVVALSVLWLVAAWLLSKAVRVGAFILERGLSQNKGVLAAVAALLLVIATLLKA